MTAQKSADWPLPAPAYEPEPSTSFTQRIPPENAIPSDALSPHQQSTWQSATVDAPIVTIEDAITRPVADPIQGVTSQDGPSATANSGEMRSPSRPTALNLLPRDPDEEDLPATVGWRGRVHKCSGGLISPAPSAAELQHRRELLAVNQPFARPMTIMVANPKGGAGKTPAALLAAGTFGMARGGGVVAWDNNETRGTLGVRSLGRGQDLTVWDLLANLATFERIDARSGDLAGYVRAQGPSLFDVLASDESPGAMAQIGAAEFGRLHHVLARFYRLIVVDTGNNIRSANWQAAADAADILVVASSHAPDTAFSAAWMLDHLEATGREDLARRAVTVLSASSPKTDAAATARIVEHFAARTSAVITVPFDPALAAGERITHSTLAESTRAAWLTACAAISAGLAEIDTTSSKGPMS